MENQNKRVALQIATFAALFGLMTFFMEMMEKNEEQVTYSITLEDLLHAQTETNGETGGGSTDGENGGGGNGGETGGGTGGNTNNGNAYNWKTIRKCKWVTYTFKLDASGNVISGSIKVHKHSCTNCAYECDTSSSGNCEQPNLCKQSDPYPS